MSLPAGTYTRVTSVPYVVPVVRSDVFAVDNVSEGKDDVTAQLDVDLRWRETRGTRTLLRRAAVIAEHQLRRRILFLLLLLLLLLPLLLLLQLLTNSHLMHKHQQSAAQCCRLYSSSVYSKTQTL